MNVETLRSTPRPERLVCQAARGDYYDGFVGDTGYAELMDDVPTDDRHEAAVEEIMADREAVTGNGLVTGLAIKQYALLERLFRRGHWGPFEHPQITLAVEGVSRSCMAQLTRHRHASFDVQSQRYVDFGEKEDPVKVPKSITDPDHATRGEGPVDLDGVDRDYVASSFDDLAEDCVDWYERMVEHGVPKEDARFALPIGTTVNMTLSVNARMLLHIEDMRKTGESQWEIRELTEMVHDEFADWMPMTAHLYEEHGPHALAP